MILIADGGSTKTDWSIVSGSQEIYRIKTRGINPYFQTEEEILSEIEERLIPEIKEYPTIKAVYFYGAGCAFSEKNEMLRRAIAHYLPVQVEVGSDLLAAARALCGRQSGIACILGTGSNSCQYDGKEIVKKVPPLGFMLGDEGAGSVLGRLLVSDALKNQLPPALSQAFFEEYHLTQDIVLEKVYRQPFPNRFLAGLSPFLLEHIEEPSIQQLVCKSFTDFFTRNVMQYEYLKYPVHFVGSIAWYYQEQLKDVARRLDIEIGVIERSPLPGLISYHGQS
ncbi:ATPase [Parabacteroides acidifaciens]|uniref:ATPase n=1 Tax=Parabacteroides acidifaciens TaxID=2290935 RepID=A0A3D8HC12_9BACT|nr:ATPase [Parabacteroides acidifaciens]MBC8603116.1 ATPase [Parabacteroides acidifaciens]RDU48182.1 ATPase [Parabacteroides acidifaciens]